MKKKLLSLFLALTMVCSSIPYGFSAIDPKKNVGKKIPAMPYDENRKPTSVLVIPIVESGEIVGYLPAKGTDNSDGTATLNTTGAGGGGVDPVGLKNIAAATINPATEDTLVLVKTNLDDLKTKLDTLNANDFSTEATLALIKTAIDAINADIDVALSTRASEATLALIKTGVDDLNTKLATLNATDFATETTLATKASEATLATRATEATLATRATEATLATRATEVTLLAIKAQTDKLTFVVDELKVIDDGVGGGGVALGKRLKHYNITKNISDSPVTLTVKADMDTVYSASDSQVRDVIFTQPSQDINVTFTTADGTSESILIKKNEVFSLSSFEFTTIVITISVDNTAIRILAEGV